MQKFRVSKTGHLFQAIFLVLCLLVVCLLAYTTFFMDRYVFREQEHELDHSNLQMLEQVSDTVTRTVTDLEQQVRIFLSDQTLMQYLLTPGAGSSEDSIHIMKSLKNYVEISPMVRHLCLYAPLSDSMLSSDGYFTSRRESHASLVLDLYESMEEARSTPDTRIAAVTVDGELYLLVDFVPARQLGCFIFQLDPARFGVDLEDSQGHILTVDPDGTLLMNGSRLAYGTEYFSLSNQSLFYSDPAAYRAGQRYYRVVNDKLDWTLLLEVQDVPTIYDRGTFLRMILPVLAVVLAVGALCAYFISMAVYRPINRLLTHALSREETPDSPEPAVDYLGYPDRQALEDNQQLRDRVALLGRGVRQYLFRQALSGTLGDETDLREVELSDAFPAGTYQVALVTPGESSLHLGEALKSNLLLEALKKQAGQFPACLCCLEGERDSLILLFHRSEPEEPPADAFHAFREQAEARMGCRLIFGLGTLCAGPAQFRDSWEQARRELQYHAYLADDPDPAAVRSLQGRVLEERITQAVEQAVLDPGAIDALALTLVEESERGMTQAQDRLNGYLWLQDLFLERLAFQEEAVTLPQLTNTAPEPGDRESCLHFCRQALETCRQLAGKKKYRYVEAGKKFMEENYTNCSLGLSDISAHVGTSPSYFSSLFNELARESVTSYLNRVRVEHAQSLLTVTHISVKEIGFRCGFNSANVFGRVFKKYTGQSPSQFREANQTTPKEVTPP